MHKLQPSPGTAMPATFPPTYVDAQGVTLSAYLDNIAGAYRRACDVGVPQSLEAAAEAMRREIRSRLNGAAPSLRACAALIMGRPCRVFVEDLRLYFPDVANGHITNP